MDSELCAAASLRTASHCLTTTPAKQLPFVVSRIAGLVSNCKTCFGSDWGPNSPLSHVARKFMTKLLALAGAKSHEGRWAAVVLIKSTVEAGGLLSVQDCANWVRSLLAVFDGPGPAATKVLCIVTLTRIFLLTRAKPDLVREVTTPSLPGFINSCLNSLRHQSSNQRLVGAILDSFSKLLPHHSPVFRTFKSRLANVLSPMIAPAFPNDAHTKIDDNSHASSSAVHQKARKLIVMMHLCAPKSTSSEYSELLASVLTEIDSDLTAVMRGFDAIPDGRGEENEESIMAGSSQSLHLPPWNGVNAGCARLRGLFALLREFVAAQTAAPISFPVGRITDVLFRLLAITGASVVALSSRRTADKSEIDTIISNLHDLQASAVAIFEACQARFRGGILSLHRFFLDYFTWDWSSRGSIHTCRIAIFSAALAVLSSSGGAFGYEDARRFVPLIESSCRDLILAARNSDSWTSTSSYAPDQVRLLTRFLETFLSRVPSQHLPHKIRSSIDQIGLLAGHHNVMVASVLNPPLVGPQHTGTSSILPLAYQRLGTNLAAEGLTRPRMPVGRVAPEHVESGVKPLNTFDQTETRFQAKKEDAAVPNIPPRMVEHMTNGHALDATTGISHSDSLQQGKSPFDSGEVSQLSANVRADVSYSDVAEGSDDEGEFKIPELNMDSDTENE